MTTVLIEPRLSILPAGVVRQIRVNRNRLEGMHDKPFVVTNPETKAESFYDEVRWDGPARMVFAEKEVPQGCYPSYTAFVETAAELEVR